jgi:dTDP-4-amino-4,6-dideoxygalactose transaminase
MNVPFLDLKKNYLSIKEEIGLEFNQLFEKCDFVHGEKVHIFEENFSKYIGINHFIGCANGTDALEVAVQSLDLQKDDEIIVQGNTYIATCLGVLNNHIKLVLCDIEKNTHMIDLNKLNEKITSKTKAIIVVHLYGLVPDMDKIVSLCKEKNLYLIEDCAQSHGALWKEQRVGSFGDISCFSFYPGKNLGAYGDGGGIGTNSDVLNEKIRKLMNLGCKIKYQHELIGRNSRLDTLQASFLNVKLKYLDSWNEMRRKNAELYKLYLNDNKLIETPNVLENSTPVYHLFVIRTKYRDELQEYLKLKNITSLIHYPISIAETQAMSSYQFKDVENCIINSKEILSLPMYPELEENKIKYVCEQINNFFLEKNLIKIESINTLNKPGILNCINNIHFDVKRLFYINSFDNLENNKRGFHANVNFDELLVVIEGNVSIKLINKDKSEIIVKKNKDELYFIPRNNWIEYEILDKNAIILVLANEILSKSVSIKNFNEFIL